MIGINNMEELDKLDENKPLRDEKGRLLPGQTANPNGRPKGKTMKEFAREFLMNKTEEEKEEWLSKVNPVDIWKMAEGMPKQDMEIDATLSGPSLIRLNE